jgi:Protein of unknown function (DUF2950)
MKHVSNVSRNFIQSRIPIAYLGLCFGAMVASLLLTTACGNGTARSGGTGTAFATPEDAAEALVVAAENFDVQVLTQILGPDGVDLVVTGEPVFDQNQSEAFAAQAREQMQVTMDPEDPKVAILSVGVEDWPLPMPIVEKRGKWRFDTAAGRDEILYRRIGRNEIDAIEICLGFVEAQYDYASEKHDGAMVNQYARRVISSPGTQDGLAWQASDGSWQGPVGEAIGRIIAEGYTESTSPFHGYYFKILEGQGPDAPLGEMDFVIHGAMIGGFGLVAAPAEYGMTGVKTFIVSHNGIVFEQDLGEDTLDQYRTMKVYNPEPSWEPVAEN